MGWQPSRFLTDRAEAERAFALAEQLGSVNAAAKELGTTWPSLHKAFGRHGLGMPTDNPEAVRQRAIAAARQRTGQPATPTLDPVFAALNRAPSQPESGRRPSCMSGSAATRSTPPWAPTWSSSSTAKATPASHHPGLGDHPPRRTQPAAGRPTRQPLRAPSHRPSGPHDPAPATPGAGVSPTVAVFCVVAGSGCVERWLDDGGARSTRRG